MGAATLQTYPRANSYQEPYYFLLYLPEHKRRALHVHLHVHFCEKARERPTQSNEEIVDKIISLKTFRFPQLNEN